jgi:putative hemolysin
MNELPNPFSLFNLKDDSVSAILANKFSNKLSHLQESKIFKEILPNIGKKLKKNKKIAKKELKLQEKLGIATTPIEAPTVKTKAANPIQVTWARHADEVKEAQKLRYKVFAKEMGANLPKDNGNLDVDMFDKYCDHLIVRDRETLKVIGTYRALPPHQARQIGCLYSDSEFDLVRLNHLRHKIVEIGRSCVHPDYRTGGVIMALWGGLGQYMNQNGYEIMIGCASVQMNDGGHYAASLNRMFQEEHMASIEYRVFPRLGLSLDNLDSNLNVDPPALIKGYLRLGAKICGEPAWDHDFNTADFLTMLRLSDINPRYAKHFLGN